MKLINVLSDCQSGFRRNHRTTDALFILSALIQNKYKLLYADGVETVIKPVSDL